MPPHASAPPPHHLASQGRQPVRVGPSARPCPHPCLLLQSVLAGTGYLSRRMSRVDALPYRQAVVEHVGLVEAPQAVPVITMLNKKASAMRVGRSGALVL